MNLGTNLITAFLMRSSGDKTRYVAGPFSLSITIKYAFSSSKLQATETDFELTLESNAGLNFSILEVFARSSDKILLRELLFMILSISRIPFVIMYSYSILNLVVSLNAPYITPAIKRNEKEVITGILTNNKITVRRSAVNQIPIKPKISLLPFQLQVQQVV